MAKSKKKPVKKIIAKKSTIKKSKPAKVKAKTKAKPKVKKSAVKKTVAKKAIAKKTVKAVSKPYQAPVKAKAKLADVTQFVTPLDDRMIVQVEDEETKTAGGLYIPDTALNTSGHRRGIVLSVGRGHRDAKGRLRPMDVQKGDRVIFSDHSGNKFQFENQELLIVRETEILGILI